MTLGLSLLDSVSIKTAAFSCLLQWQGLLSWHIAITTHDLHAQRRFFIGPQTKIIKVLSSQLWYRLDFFDWKACSSEILKHSARVQIDRKMERLQRLSSHLRAQPVASAEVPLGGHQVTFCTWSRAQGLSSTINLSYFEWSSVWS